MYVIGLPSNLLLSPSGEEFHENLTFIGTWDPFPLTENSTWYLSISPTPQNGNANSITSNSFILNLMNNTFYYVNVSFCLNFNIYVQFMIGKIFVNA